MLLKEKKPKTKNKEVESTNQILIGLTWIIAIFNALMLATGLYLILKDASPGGNTLLLWVVAIITTVTLTACILLFIKRK
jgi:type IV secretory pathway TrbD component